MTPKPGQERTALGMLAELADQLAGAERPSVATAFNLIARLAVECDTLHRAAAERLADLEAAAPLPGVAMPGVSCEVTRQSITPRTAAEADPARLLLERLETLADLDAAAGELRAFAAVIGSDWPVRITLEHGSASGCATVQAITAGTGSPVGAAYVGDTLYEAVESYLRADTRPLDAAGLDADRACADGVERAAAVLDSGL